ERLDFQFHLFDLLTIVVEYIHDTVALGNGVRQEVDVVAVRCQAAVGRVVVVGERPASRDYAVTVEAQQLEAPAIRHVGRVKVVLRVGGDAAKRESALPSQAGCGRRGSDQ